MSSLYTEIIDNRTYLVGELNVYKCKTIGILMTELEKLFQWRENEGPHDAMYHLDWFEEKNFKLIANKFHAIKDEKQKQLLKEEFDRYVESWTTHRKNTNSSDGIFIVEYR